MRTLTLLVVLLSLSACATCERHPLACTVAGAIVVGSIAASYGAHDNRTHDTRIINGTPCGHFWACPK
jgi:hypothetical protein